MGMAERKINKDIKEDIYKIKHYNIVKEFNDYFTTTYIEHFLKDIEEL